MQDKCRRQNLLEDNIEEYLYDSEIENYFLNRTQKVLIIKEEIGKLITLKETVYLDSRVKSQSRVGKRYLQYL